MYGAAVATGAHGEYGAQGGAQVAASGAAYVGGQAGAQTAGRLNQLHGQSGHSRAQQQPEAAGIVATASKISNFFMILCLLRKQGRNYCFGRNV
jgi:hypothetical protein